MHHSHDVDPEISKALSDMYKKIGNIRSDETLEPFLGPTGKFPDGKLTEKDEGEIAFAVLRKDGKVVIDFNSQVTWVGMSPEQALDLSRILKKHARKLMKGE